MKRKQIYLESWQDEAISTIARRERLSESAVIRRELSRTLGPKESNQQSIVEFFKELSKGTEKLNIPPDVSERVDYYLYGEGSEEFK